MPVHDLFQSHHLRLYRYLFRLSGERPVAEDLTQDVFLRALRAESTFTSSGRDEAWLFRIARNLWIDRRRRLSRRPTAVEPGLSLDGDLSSCGDLSAPASQELRLRLDQALQGLAEEEREAFLLRETGGLSYAQIASVCRVSVEAVRSRIYRARRDLRRALTEEKTLTEAKNVEVA